MLALETIPSDLPSAYKDVLYRIERNGKGVKDLVFKILSWIFYIREPLKMNALCEALAVEAGDSRIQAEYLLEPFLIVEICESLITYDETTGIVRFNHFTVREFLQRNSIDELLSTNDLAKVCLTYLTFEEFENGPCRKYEKLVTNFHQRHPFGSYAARHWCRLVRGRNEQCSDVVTLVLSLLASSPKRHLMLQLKEDATNGVFCSQSALHVIATNGLAAICKIILATSEDGSRK